MGMRNDNKKPDKDSQMCQRIDKVSKFPKRQGRLQASN